MITSEDVEFLMAANPQASGLVLSDLSISKHRCKFRQAVERELRHGGDPFGWDFWYSLRKSALEHGVPYLDGYAPRKQE